MPYTIYFHSPLLNVYLSAIETLICHKKMSLIRLSSSVLQKIRYMIVEALYKSHSDIVIDKCHKNETGKNWLKTSEDVSFEIYCIMTDFMASSSLIMERNSN